MPETSRCGQRIQKLSQQRLRMKIQRERYVFPGKGIHSPPRIPREQEIQTGARGPGIQTEARIPREREIQREARAPRGLKIQREARAPRGLKIRMEIKVARTRPEPGR